MDKINPKIVKTWIIGALVIVIFILFVMYSDQNQRNKKVQEEVVQQTLAQIAINSTAIAQIIPFNNPTVDPYKDCITWQETEYHDGEYVCVIGKVLFIKNVLDDISGNRIWAANFGSMGIDSFNLISVGVSLDEWLGKCVIVHGTLVDRSKLDPDYKIGPLMHNDETSTNFYIIEVPDALCP